MAILVHKAADGQILGYYNDEWDYPDGIPDDAVEISLEQHEAAVEAGATHWGDDGHVEPDPVEPSPPALPEPNDADIAFQQLILSYQIEGDYPSKQAAIQSALQAHPDADANTLLAYAVQQLQS